MQEEQRQGVHVTIGAVMRVITGVLWCVAGVCAGYALLCFFGEFSGNAVELTAGGTVLTGRVVAACGLAWCVEKLTTLLKRTR